jgi:dihydroxyacid dehydratase/phosphogluconate dehydratase
MLQKPIVGIAYTPSGFNNCHRHFPELLEAVKRGVLAAGALPLEFPTISLGEVFLHPTSLKFRNLMSMDTEEMIRAQPMDSVVLMGGCDKTVPAQLMGAISANRPAIQLVAGPMMTGRHRGERIGACTDCRRFWASYRAGQIDTAEIEAVEERLAVTSGTCGVMGTASTMASMAEALGLTLPDNAAIPAVDSRRYAQAHLAGRRIVDLVKDDVRISTILTRAAFENAIRVNGAVGGSTNAVLHLLAIAGRVGVPVTLQDWDDLGRTVPTLVDLMPSGRFLMEDFYYAGGLPAVIRTLGEQGMLNRDAMTVNGQTIWDNCREAPNFNPEVIRPIDRPLAAHGGSRCCAATSRPRAPC